jgi:hypothetical protein
VGRKHLWVVGAATLLPLLTGSLSPAQASTRPQGVHNATPRGRTIVARPAQTSAAFASPPSRVTRTPVAHHVRVPAGVTVVIGHTKTLGEALAFVARAQVYSGLTGVAVEQDGPTDFEIFVGPFSTFKAGQAFRASVDAKFRHVTVESEAKSSDALKLTDLPVTDGSAVSAITPVEAP